VRAAVEFVRDRMSLLHHRVGVRASTASGRVRFAGDGFGIEVGLDLAITEWMRWDRDVSGRRHRGSTFKGPFCRLERFGCGLEISSGSMATMSATELSATPRGGEGGNGHREFVIAWKLRRGRAGKT